MQHRVACAQMTSTENVKQNLAMAETLIQQAAAENARLVVLPEMFALMGMDQDAKLRLREDLGHGLLQDFLQKQAEQHSIWLVGGTIPIMSTDKHRARAACLVFDDKGNQVACYDKIHLFDVHLRASQENYSESQSIEPGEQIVVLPTPFGRLGLAVCYDIRFPEMFRQMQAQDVELIAMPAAFTYTTGLAHFEVLVRARAIENLSYMLTACQTGTHNNGRKTYGHSMIVSPWGEVKAVLPNDIGVITADIDLDYMHQLRKDFPVLTHRKF